MNLNDLLENYIPYPIRTKVSSIDPRLDVFWQDYLFETFRELSPKDRENVMKQILTPKHIIWNKDSKKFEYNPPPKMRKVLILKALFVKSRPNTNK